MKGLCTAPSFVVPLLLQELESPPEDGENRLYAVKVIDIETLQPDEVEELVKGLAFDLADKEVLCIEEQAIFDQLYSLVRGFSLLEPSAKGSLIESLCSNFSVLLPNITSLLKSAQDASYDASSLGNHIQSHRNAFRIYSYFIQSIAFAEEAGADTEKEKTSSKPNSKAKQSRKKHLPRAWDWEVQRTRIARLLAAAVNEDLKQLFGASQPEETLLAYLAKGAFSMLEDPAALKDKDLKDSLYSVVGACSTKYQYLSQTTASILHLLHKHEHLPSYLAELVASAERKYHDGSLAVSLIREIGRLNPKDYARDGAGADNIGKFLVEMADQLPRLVATNVGILMPHFGGESYKIRSALISVLGKLVSKAFKEADGNTASETSRLRSKQAMIDVMMERSRDTSAYTRSRVLQTWADLCEEHAVSIGLWNQVAEMAAGRLEDKAAIVRKSALHLLATLLQYNPFGPQLRTAAFEATLEKYKAQLDNMSQKFPSDVADDGEQLEDTGNPLSAEADAVQTDIDHVVPDVGIDTEFCKEDSGPSQTETQTQAIYTSDVGGVEQTRALVASLEAGLRFAKCIASTMPLLVQLLASSNATDVEYTIQLLMCARQFNVDGAESCLRKMLPLIFSQEKAIHDAVESAFLTIYVKKGAFDTALNLINLTMEASIGDLASMERIVSTLVKKGDISQNTILALWDFFTFNAPGITSEQSRGALVVLSMVAKTSPKVLINHLQNVVDIGFGRWAKEDMLLARTACNILQQLPEEDRSTLISSHKIFNNLSNLLLTSGLPEESWYGTAEQAVNAIYILHPMPEAFASSLLKRLHCSVFAKKESQQTPSSSNFVFTTETEKIPTIDYPVSITSLSRFLFLVGHIALKHFVYIDSCTRKIRKQRNEKEKLAAEKQESLSATDSQNSGSKEENINAELGVTASEDVRIDALQEQAEKEIISGRRSRKFLIGSCAPLVAKICRNFNLLQEFPVLQSSAMLALCKLMVLDSEFCEENLQLLFTVAQNAAEDNVRSNCIIALGDLVVRFPNLLEPWTEHVYARLHDKSPTVRKNAVLVLSHLILNDMMKVKGHITEMTLRLEDEDMSISNSVKLFFHELSKKGNNPIYNLLPDVLSRLSGMKNLQQETFNNIMQFLISSIKKDKQMEGLIEKLCHRFIGSTDSGHWQNISYCLTQLTYSERGIRKLADLFKTYQHALGVDEVVNNFKAIISKAKKFAKTEVKAVIDEFEQKIVECHEEKKEQEATMLAAQSHMTAQLQSKELIASNLVTALDNTFSANQTTVEDGSKKEASPAVLEGKENDSEADGTEGDDKCGDAADHHSSIEARSSEGKSIRPDAVSASSSDASCRAGDDKDGDAGEPHSSTEDHQSSERLQFDTGCSKEDESSECSQSDTKCKVETGDESRGKQEKDVSQRPRRKGRASPAERPADAISDSEKENINDVQIPPSTPATKSTRRSKAAEVKISKTTARPRRKCVG